MASSSPLRLGSSFNVLRAPVKSGRRPSRSDAERGAYDEGSALYWHSERGRYFFFMQFVSVANERILPPTLPSGKVGGSLTSEAS